ncbi:6-phospho-beta-glucosidase [Clostridium tetanomorphum]|uniref:6-phospho-beta-glucosidase n=1 Tax=Clostridium tetanomorphum TaxID=1553 RepID=A0A923J0L3_CLOTT|nr:6-phospho-beta-glucosidase [Clostridium tetanomorphum]KAJ49201.1 glycoside hydrolase family protein [Clostridium tetanomorphum DSM 665]KAJ51251.1 glycoside hydrolase family protein [Clostridium tetanomorphum DSM 665]MBC2397839.1 6-phospho-beta-glucosidase [Clostridium tetanomorphum]MBP1864849.1 6-phospho-beta-glucosidase [Clostridium tetanomorphum]NRS84025.1 6-phospho-beta-glucosidase [Clostridium tetanomorphum]
MKGAIKIVTIGGGSSYTPELMEGFIKRYDELLISEIWLVDIEDGKEKLDIVGNLAQRMWDATPYNVKVVTTLHRKEALKGADFVTTQFRVGLLDARIKDERIPLLHGMLGQETNGAGGIFKAFRTIPVIKDIINDMKVLCPDAWLINFTNPSGIITEAIIKHFGWKKCIGLCNVPVISMMNEPKVIGMQSSKLHYQFAGLNHFHWHKVFDEEGKEVTGQLIEHINEKNGGTPANIYQAKFPLELLHSMNLLPCGYHRYYYCEKEMLEHSLEEFKKGGTRAEQMKEVEVYLFEIYKNPDLNKKPEELQKRGGAYYSDAACECISAIYNNKGLHMVVSTQNNGAIPCLDSDSIVEVSCIISAKGAEPVAWGEMASFEKGWLQIMKAMEECTINAALTGDYGIALEAFIINPLIQNGSKAKQVLDELLVAHEKYLPQFKEKIIELKAQGVASKDPVVVDLIKNGH